MPHSSGRIPGVLLRVVQHNGGVVHEGQWVSAEWRIYVSGNYNMTIRYDAGNSEYVEKDISGTMPKLRLSKLKRAMEDVHSKQIGNSVALDEEMWQFLAYSDSGDVLFEFEEPVFIHNSKELQKLVVLLPGVTR